MEMDDEAILALYTWAAGNCFNCARVGVPTARIAEVTPDANGDYEVRACRSCVLALEEMSRRAAERDGEVYQPGALRRASRRQ